MSFTLTHLLFLSVFDVFLILLLCLGCIYCLMCYVSCSCQSFLYMCCLCIISLLAYVCCILMSALFIFSLRVISITILYFFYICTYTLFFIRLSAMTHQCIRVVVSSLHRLCAALARSDTCDLGYQRPRSG